MLAGLLAVWLALLVLILLTACSGDGAAPQAVQAPAQPPMAEPAAPEVITPGGTGWRQVWGETWQTFAPGGWVRHSLLNCNGGTVDPDKAPENSFAAGAAWSVFGNVMGSLDVRDGALHIDSHQHAGGYALLSGRIWPTDRPLAVQATVQLRPDPGAWLGLTLIADETDYRELALYEVGGRISAGVWHPCKIDWGVAADLQDGPRTLRLEYTPAGPVCWRHYVDGTLVASERCSVPGAPLVNPARVGLYVVNLRAEGLRVPGLVRATVGPVVVEGVR